MLAKLGIRQKLGLLLLIPLSAVVLVMVPFVAERIDGVRSAGVTARTAEAARQVGVLIQALEQERLLAVGFLATTSMDRGAVLSQSEDAVDDAARLRAAPATAAVLERASDPLANLDQVRARVLDRSIDAESAYDAYRQADAALLDALDLASPSGADAAGLIRLGALDALMRSTEEASSVGAILVAVVADPQASRTLLTDPVTADQQHLRRFRELASPDQAALVNTVEFVQAAQRIRDLVTSVTRTPAAVSPQAITDALTAAITYTGLRRLAQDRVAREIAADASRRASASRITAVSVAGGGALLFVGMVALGVTVSRSISRPLRRLTHAATVVAELSRAELVRVADTDSPDPAPPQLAAVEVNSLDEVGELAAALNRVQATAFLLLERQVSTRRNVAVMFANIARRTQNLVGRQLSLIDDLERSERNPELLQRLYRLDHVATRLRRSADSLLVVSGTIDQQMAGTPTPLVDVVRSAVAEIEGFRSVQFGDISDVAVSAGLVADLRLLLAELLENATNFSPPGTPVRVFATLDDECRITIVDHGLGLSAARLDEENRRLVERERLDVAPTSVLGLFVVGRLARRHGLSVTLSHSDGRGITATVRVPLPLLTAVPLDGHPVVAVGRTMPQLVIEAMPAGWQPFEPAEPFAWFALGLPAITAPAAVGRATVATVDASTVPLPRRSVSTVPDTTADAEPATRSGLTRRVAGTHLVEAMRDEPPEAPTQRIARDPQAERDALNDYLSGLLRSTEAGPPAEETS